MYQKQPMPSIVKILRAAADPTRLRILLLLQAEELSVAELQEILVMGQSTISTHLSQLKQAGLVEDRRTGKSSWYRIAPQAVITAAVQTAPAASILKGHDFSAEAGPSSSPPSGPEGRSFVDDLLLRAELELPQASADRAAMRTVVKKRQDRMRSFFDSMAGRLGKDYVPGKSWKSLAEALLRLMPPMIIADLGAGDGASALLFSRNAAKVMAVDSSAKMLEVGRETAARHGIENVEFRLGDMEEVPIADGEVDLAFFSQSLHHALHPDRAVGEAARILRPAGRVAILDLAKHRFEEARELYADPRLGFSEAELTDLLEAAGFRNVTTSVVDKENEPPHFQTLLAIGEK
jgi:ubiquinone/menaquinone biosynthesis C-methylase UbiE/DNA-binding transcriptional ArsR family regulator